MADSGITSLAVCAGIGGLELGISFAFRTRVLCYVEREAFSAAVLLARMEDEALEPAPVWCGSLEEFDARPFAGVDLVTAGLPCQSYSLAGKREGHADERAIWPEFIRIVAECQPAMVFLENVPAFVSGGFFREPGEELSRMGYRIERPLFLRASDLGAPHRRERVFILAIARAWRADGPGGSEGGRASGEPRRPGGILADAIGAGLERRPLEHHGERQAAERGCGPVAHADQERHRPGECDLHAGEPDADGSSAGLWPPGPDDDWSGVPEELWPSRPESCFRRGTTGLSPRLDQLRALGNAVVPLQAGAAFAILADGAGLVGRRTASAVNAATGGSGGDGKET